MYKQCTTELTTARQRKLEQCLLELLKSNSYESITVKDICAAAGVPRGMFYRYFDSKKDALDALIDHTLVEYMTSEVFVTKREADDPMGMRALLQYWKSQKPLLDALKRNKMEVLLLERSIRYCTQEEPVLSRQLEAVGRPSELEAVVFCINGVISTIFLWYQSGFARSAEEMAQILRALLGPIVKRNGAE
ncbi:MAG: TetR/AcrR family transcriptional regulator [Oscillospiraceae bacterium]|nr:TetR/AcrR family transcriptional regulator [Oscillospiraceae bacterium]